jgi:exoribonuclease-2
MDVLKDKNGQIVEFIEASQLNVGWVINFQGERGRIEVMASSGQILKLSSSRILTTTEQADPGDKALRLNLLNQILTKRLALTKEVDLQALWLLLEEEGDDFPFPLLASLAFAREPGADEISAIIRSILENGLLFNFTPQSATRQKASEVEHRIQIKAREKEKKELLSLGAAWIRKSLDQDITEEPDNSQKIKKILIDFAVCSGESKDKKEAKEILKEALLSETPEGAFLALKAIGEFSEHENLDFRRLGLTRDFTSEALEEASYLAENFSLNTERRMDLTNLPIITVDAAGAREFDDAISLNHNSSGQLELGLHIADVAALVSIGSPLDNQAATKTVSSYLPEAKYSMLPEILTEKVLSLRQGSVKPAFSLLVTVSREGRIESLKMSPSLISVERQISFNEADQILEESDELTEFYELAKIFHQKRKLNGSFSLDLPRLNIFITPDGRPEISILDWDTPARFMVGEYMILANHLAAEILRKNNLPCPYRFQEKSRFSSNLENENTKEEEKKENYLTSRTYLAEGLAKRRLMGRSGLSLKPTPHYGLGLSVYTSFTSPMRRYLDLLVARQLRALSLGQEIPYDQQAMMNLAMPTDETQKAIKKMQNARHRYWLIYILSQKLGETFAALVFERLGNRFRVCIPDFMLEFDLFNLPSDIPLGSDILVKVTKAEPRADILHFEYVKQVAP